MRTANERANERHRSSNMERPDVFLTSKVASSSLFLSLCILLRWLNSPKLLESVELFHELSRNFQTLSISQTSKLPPVPSKPFLFLHRRIRKVDQVSRCTRLFMVDRPISIQRVKGGSVSRIGEQSFDR